MRVFALAIVLKEALSLWLDGGAFVPSTIPSPTCVDNQRDATAARAESISAIAASQQPSALFDDVVKIAEEVARTRAKVIPPRWTPPSSLAGTSCVYILEIGANPPRYYVGETDSLSRRLSQHRRKGPEWKGLTAIAVPVPGGKSDSRNVESLVIRKLAKAGYDMVSIEDGRNVRKGSNST